MSGSSVITVASVLPAYMRGLFIVADKEKICNLKSMKKTAETFLVANVIPRIKLYSDSPISLRIAPC